jgi:hypothetical protein
MEISSAIWQNILGKILYYLKKPQHSINPYYNSEGHYANIGDADLHLRTYTQFLVLRINS